MRNSSTDEEKDCSNYVFSEKDVKELDQRLENGEDLEKITLDICKRDTARK